MKTWRERIAEARERGGFTKEDCHLACASSTCAVGEVSARYGWEPVEGLYLTTPLPGEPVAVEQCPTWTLGVRHSSQFTAAVLGGDIAEAERLLDAIENRAMVLKREAH